MIDNKNTSEYWDDRFSTGNWHGLGGQDQTRKYAHLLIKHWHIAPDFAGTILDFGCALGDAIPVYRDALPKAKFLGMDHSGAAIAKCKELHGDSAEFVHGDESEVPDVDVIICSHTLEHITDDLGIAKVLRSKCRDLYIVVPYREDPLCHEHLRMYDEHRFAEMGEHTWQVFVTKSYPMSWRVLLHVHLKNLFRPLLGKPTVKPLKAIMYHFGSHD